MGLIEIVERRIKNLTESIFGLYDELEAVRKLPKEIEKLEGGYCSYFEFNDGRKVLTVNLYGGSADQLVCECAGVTFEKPEFSKSSGTFSTSGKMEIEIDTDKILEVNVSVAQVDAPAGCQIIKKRKMGYVFEATCAEGKPID